MKHYTAKVSRDGRFWLIHVPEIDQLTQARNAEEITLMATELIVLVTQEPADSFELTIETEHPDKPAPRSD